MAVSVVAVGYLRFAPPLFTAVMLWAKLGAVFSGQALDIDYRWVSWQRISPQLARAVVAAEDQRFALHHGFDFQSMRAAVQASQRGRRLRGASTITQQTAKNLFLWSGRSWLRKAMEAYLTICLELMLPKQRILELYLNIVELAPGIYGAEAAAQRFFRKPAAQLTVDEAALLAAVLPNPHRLLVNRPSPYVRARAARIAKQMSQLPK